MNLTYHMAEAWRGMRRAHGVALASALSLLAAWLVLAGTTDALWNGWRFVRAAESRKEVIVLMKEHPGAGADSALATRLKGLEESASVQYVPPDSAWAQLTRDMGSDPELLQSVGANPLPPTFRVGLKEGFRTTNQITHLAETVKQYPEVDDVVYGGDWIEQLEVWLRRMTILGLAFGISVGLGVVVLIMFTIRLALLARRDVLRVVRLLGADEGFVRTPFVLEGLILCAVTAIPALAVVEGASRLFTRSWSDWRTLPWQLDAGFIGVALLLGLVGSLVGSMGVGHSETR